MKKSLKNICGIVLLVGGLWGMNSQAMDDSNQVGNKPTINNAQDTENIKNKVPAPAPKSSWFGWLWPFGKKTEPIVKVEQKVEQKGGDATKKHYVRSTKDIVFGLTPAAVIFYALFLMPDSAKQHLSKDLLMILPESVKQAKYMPEKFLMFLKDKNCLMLLNNPKVMGTLCGVAGFYLSHKISKVRNDLLNSKNIVDVGGQAVEKGLGGAMADETTRQYLQELVKNAAVDAVFAILKSKPLLLADLAPSIVKMGGGISDEQIRTIAEEFYTRSKKEIDVLIELNYSTNKKLDESLELQKLIYKQVKENQPLANKLYYGVCNKVAAFGAGVSRRIEKIDFDTFSPFPEEVDFRYSTAEAKE